MFPKIRDRKVWWLTFIALAIGSFHLFSKWDALWASENYALVALLMAVPVLAIYLLVNISAFRQNSAEPRSEGTKS